MRRDRILTGRLMAYLRPYRPWVLLAILLLIIARAAEVVVPLLLGKAVDAAFDSQWSVTRQLCSWVLALLLFSYLLDAVKTAIKCWAGQKAIFHLRIDLFSFLLQRTTSFFDHNRVGVLMSRCIHDVDQVSKMLTETLIPMMGSACLLVGIMVAIFFVDVRLALLFLAVIPLVAGLTGWFRLRQRTIHERVRQILAHLNGIVQEQLMGSSVLRIFGRQASERAEFTAANASHAEANIEGARTFSLFFASIDLVQSTLLISLFVVLALTATAEDGFRAGTYFAFSLYILMLFRPLADLAERYNVFQGALASANQIFELLEQPDSGEDLTAGETLAQIETLTFQDVWFRYEEGPWVLQGIDFQLRRGETLALVGITGAGKSTLFHLILRLYPLTRGSILINGQPIERYSLASLRQQVVAVLQDPQLFSGTIGENINLFAEHTHPPSVERKIMRLLDGLGWDQQVGRGGNQLSTGQRQLVAFARAAARNGSLLVLDEATAHVDSGSELLVQQALTELLSGCTAFVIAHRLSTIKHADRILVLHKGRICEEGTHTQLLERQGLYDKLYRLQVNGAE